MIARTIAVACAQLPSAATKLLSILILSNGKNYSEDNDE
jgi:hypothetical protein